MTEASLLQLELEEDQVSLTSSENSEVLAYDPEMRQNPLFVDKNFIATLSEEAGQPEDKLIAFVKQKISNDIKQHSQAEQQETRIARPRKPPPLSSLQGSFRPLSKS